jgi:tetratricopeptide (TPR) repeat protein
MELNELVRLFPDSINAYHLEAFNEFNKIDHNINDSVLSDEINKYLGFLYSIRKYKKLKEVGDQLITQPNIHLKKNIYENVLYYKAFLDHIDGTNNEALDTLKQAKAIFKLKGCIDVDIQRYLFGIIYSSKEKYELSNSNLFDLTKVSKDQDKLCVLDSINLAGGYNLIGKNYTALDDFENARKFLLKSQSYNLGRTDYEVLNLIALGTLYEKEGSFDMAISALLNAKEIILQNNLNADNYLANIYQKLGVVYTKIDKKESALFYFDSTISIARINNLKSYVFEGLLGKG